MSEQETPYLESDVLTNDNKPFLQKGACVIAISRKKLNATHEPIAVPGGFVGRKVEKKPKVPKKALECNIKCRVTRTNIDPDNTDMPISVTVNDRRNKREFLPGQEVMLSRAHINVLRDSVEETRLFIPTDSGIYTSADPLGFARRQYPGMIAMEDPRTGQIMMVNRVPNYIIEELPNGDT